MSEPTDKGDKDNGPGERPAAPDMIELVHQFAVYVPFNAFLGMKAVLVEPGRVRFQVPYRPELIGDPTRPALHGGVTAALIDTVAGASVWSLLTAYHRVSTIDIRIDYLLPARLETIEAEGRVLRKGSTVAVSSVRAYHPARPEETIAEGRAVFNIRAAGHSAVGPRKDGK